ncbi:MAG: flagellar hook-associated protein FlgL [Chromatiaceae bacterium]
MRISTQQMHQRAVALMQEQQSRLARTQGQLASGKRFEAASEDPAAAVRAMRLTREIAATERYQANAEAVRTRQVAEEGALTGVTELLHAVRELVVQGKNDTLRVADRRALSESLGQRLDELLALANGRDGSGEYLFGGLQSSNPPFSRDGQGAFVYHGDQGQRVLGISPGVSVPMTDSGELVFQRVRAGNGSFVTAADPANTGSGAISAGQATGAFTPSSFSIVFTQMVPDGSFVYAVQDGDGNLVSSGDYVSGAAIPFGGAEVTVTGVPADGDRFTIEPAGFRDVFAVIQGAVQALASAGEEPGARANLQTQLDRGLAELDGALDQVLLQRSRVAGRSSLIDSQTEANDAFEVAAKEALSVAQDLDYAEATARLQLQLVGLEAAQRTYLSIQGLSLFRLLG